MVRILRKVRKKEVADKFFRRTLKLLREPIINQIAKEHNIDKKLSNSHKIEEIIKEEISFSDLLTYEIHKDGITLTKKKKSLNELCEKGLNKFIMDIDFLIPRLDACSSFIRRYLNSIKN